MLLSESERACVRARVLVRGRVRVKGVRDELRSGNLMIDRYGMSEVSGPTTITPTERFRPGSIGLPVPGISVRIDNPDEGGNGEVCAPPLCTLPLFSRFSLSLPSLSLMPLT